MQRRERYAYENEYCASKASFSAAAQKHLTGFIASQGAQPLLNYLAGPQQRYSYQTNYGVYEREEMMIRNHEAFGSGFAIREGYNNGGKWRLLAAPEGMEQNIVFKGLSSRDEHLGRKWRPAPTGCGGAPKMPEEMRSPRKQAYNVQQFADMVFEGMAASSVDERNGRKWRNMQKPAIIYQQSDAVNNTESSRQRHFDYYQTHQPEQQPYYVYEMNQSSASEEKEEMVVMDACEAAKLNGGVLILDYSNRK